MAEQGKFRALAASLRLPNLPSVWSNTLTGVIFACLIQEHGFLQFFYIPLIIASCLYFAGNLLNDWADREWDQKSRPERALPSGLFKPKHYLVLAMALIAIALGTAWFTSVYAIYVSLLLVFFILLYTWSHKRTAWGVIPMAMCRALLPILGFCATSHPIFWHHCSAWILLPAAMLFSYLIMLSLRARAESRPSTSPVMSTLTGIGFLLPILILLLTPDSPMGYSDGVRAMALAITPYVVWTGLALTAFRKPIPRQISALLAGIPLIDAMFILPYLLLGHLYLADSSFFWLAMAWAPAFILGRLLQRYVPAT